MIYEGEAGVPERPLVRPPFTALVLATAGGGVLAHMNAW